MWEPVGPLPASVYWRRRWVALGSTVTATVLLVWAIAAAATPASPDGAGDTTTRAAGRAAMTAPQQASPPPAVPAPGAVEPGPSAAVRALDAFRSPVAASEQLRPDDTPRAPVPVSPPVPPVPVPPTAPGPCADAALAVTAEIDRPQHRVGERPVLRLVVANTGGEPCVRDLDPARQEIVVWSIDGASRLWSSNDCADASRADLRRLEPGRPIAFAVTWAGRTSAPGCAQPRTAVPAGSYRVMSRVDGVISPPTPFTRTP